jgi:hypothetical protein
VHGSGVDALSHARVDAWVMRVNGPVMCQEPVMEHIVPCARPITCGNGEVKNL